MTGSLTLRVITPDRIVADETADSVRIPAVDGSMGILPRHAGMVAALDVGVLEFQAGGKRHELFVSGGFAEVRGETVRIVSEAGERPEEIDEERARAAEKRARERIDTGAGPEVDVVRARAALARSLMRLRVLDRTR
jgi:F-type H+-transporting ATPase subunit epsilon